MQPWRSLYGSARVRWWAANAGGWVSCYERLVLALGRLTWDRHVIVNRAGQTESAGSLGQVSGDWSEDGIFIQCASLTHSI